MPETCRPARYDIEDRLFDDKKRSFFPLDQLRDYFTYQKVSEILHCNCNNCQEDRRLYGAQIDPEIYVNDIIGGTHDTNDLRRTRFGVFGLLVFVEHPLFIIGFLRHNCSDYLLESWVTHTTLFSREDLETYTGDFKRNQSRFERFARRFSTNLPKFAIPHMETRNFRQYDASVVLPFVGEVEIGKREDEDGHWTSEGANGKVFAFKIHREYCKFRGINHRHELARKRIDTPEPRAFLERSNIEHVQRFNDDHIVKLVKAYGHGPTINLIFPKAWTNLDHLLRDQVFGYGHKRGAKLEMADAWKQLLGIARALKKIQGFGDGADSRGSSEDIERLCIHFDLKPDNILIEKEDGNWIITDFGQAALTRRRRGKTTPHIDGHFGTDAYAPPEIEDLSMQFGRAYDIWSLGCIILEVTSFMVLGYAGLTGSSDFVGLDQARRAMPMWSRNSDERFFCQESPNGEYVVKNEIQEFIISLERRHARSRNSSEKSKAFLKKILDLVNRMLRPNAKDRPDISRVVRTLSSALRQAQPDASAPDSHQVIAAPDETILGSPPLSQIRLWHWSAASKEWEGSSLEALENETGFMRLHCWSPGLEPTNICFRRSDVKILPLYAFWDPNNTYDTRAWLDFSFLSPDRRAVVSNAMLGFDGNSGLAEARIVQSTLTSQDIVGSYALSYLTLSRPISVSGLMKGMLSRKKKDILEFGSATIQIWVGREDIAARDLERSESGASDATYATRSVRVFDKDKEKVPTCRVAIYLHQQRFICTIRIDLNWVLEDSKTDDKMLFFRSHPPGRNRHFYASWIRPTQEEFRANCPAGVPLSPKVLQYFEDLDLIETDNFELRFLSINERESFKRKFWEVKKNWDLTRQSLDSTISVNRMPEGDVRLPPGVGAPPVPKQKARIVPTTSPRNSRTEAGSVSSASGSRSRHDSTLEEVEPDRIDPKLLMVPSGDAFRPPIGRRG